MKKEDWNALFSGKKVAQQRLASIVFRNLQQEPVKSSNCATNIHFNPATNTPPAATSISIKKSCRHTKNYVASHLLEKYHYWRKGHKKTKKNRHWNEKYLAAQMGVDSNSEGVDINSKGSDINANGVDTNANIQTLLALPPFDYCVGRCDMSLFLRDPTGCHGKKISPPTVHFPLT